MSSLNIAPNPKAVALLLIIFLANILIIKKLILESFLKLKKHRDALTTGSVAETKKIQQQNEILQKTIESKKKEAILEAQKISEIMISEAGKKQEELTREAQNKASAFLLEIRKGIQGDLLNQRMSIKEKAQQLSDVFYDKILKS